MYAVTMKHIPITIGFVIITLGQLAVGAMCIVLVAKGGGWFGFSPCKNGSYSEHFPVPLQLEMCSSTSPTDTARRIPSVRVWPA
jgi:hypothetical protein